MSNACLPDNPDPDCVDIVSEEILSSSSSNDEVRALAKIIAHFYRRQFLPAIAEQKQIQELLQEHIKKVSEFEKVTATTLATLIKQREFVQTIGLFVGKTIAVMVAILTIVYTVGKMTGLWN